MDLTTLAIDIGNTRIKLGLFNNNQFLAEYIINNHSELTLFLTQHKIGQAVMCSVGIGADEVFNLLHSHQISVLRVTHQTKFPFSIAYQTPQTLGMDRVAAIAGAKHFFGTKNCLVIDAGTCVTYDFITAAGIYQGGAISPGLEMRLKAMHQFTQKLPKPDLAWPDNMEGLTTNQSLLSGACVGLVDEINGRIERYEAKYGEVVTLICGGDAQLLAKHTKNNIFAQPSLVLYGLNQIVQFNANKG